MKRLVFVLFTLCSLQWVSGITDDLKQKAQAARLTCKQQVGLSDKEFNDWVKGVALPTTDGGTCCEVCACWMRELGYLTGGRVNLENMKAVNAQKWNNLAYVELGNKIDALCSDRVLQTGRKECEIAVDFRKCKTEQIQQYGGPPKPGST
ncbi:hypothetical protein GE061_012330 [Apolygus lucorum]|uniref:Uncharacterized protein n=1 Tax=Apolygus lucorum TaxID=248454 RepID=A0A6A4JL41_APOLU|nr:hypothetical protein GE061_012330 [Apolygus lucorum]